MKVSRKILTLFLANFVLFLIVIFLVEAIFRVVGIPYKIKYIPNENSFARYDSDLGWSYIPNKSAMNKVDDIERPVYFDENGIRIPRPGFKFDYSRPSVLFIGGSFTMGHGLSYEESFVGKFDALEGTAYQVVNLGVQGYGSDQALLALKRYLSRFNAKVVVYTFIEDHIFRNGNYDRRMLNPNARFLGTKPEFALKSGKDLYLAKKPELYKDYVNSYLFDFLRIRAGTLLGSFPPYPIELTKAIILEMKRYSNEHHARFVVLDWRWTRNDSNKLFQGLDVDVIDTMEGAPEGWDRMVLLGGIHPDARAGDHAAHLLIDYFNRKGLLQHDAKQ